jgi:hypothetical protein
MHEVGGWHVAHSKQYFENEARGLIPWASSRYEDRWTRPAMIAPGLTFAFQIVTPWWSVTSPIKAADKTKVTWIPNAPDGRVTLISVFLAAGSIPVPWGQNVGALKLRNGETARVVYWIADASVLSPFPKGVAAFYRGKGPTDISNAGDLRLLGIATAFHGARAIFDYSVRSDNLILMPPSVQS